MLKRHVAKFHEKRRWHLFKKNVDVNAEKRVGRVLVHPLGFQEAANNKKPLDRRKLNRRKLSERLITASTWTKEEQSASCKTEQWTMMGNNKRRKDLKKIHPEIMIISKKGGRRYPSDSESACGIDRIGSNVSRIRRTQKGGQMLALNKSSEKPAGSFRDQMVKVTSPKTCFSGLDFSHIAQHALLNTLDWNFNIQ